MRYKDSYKRSADQVLAESAVDSKKHFDNSFMTGLAKFKLIYAE